MRGVLARRALAGLGRRRQAREAVGHRHVERRQHLVRAPPVLANCRTHPPQKLKCLISLVPNPVLILSVPIQTVRKALNPLNRLNAIFVMAVDRIAKSPYLLIGR